MDKILLTVTGMQEYDTSNDEIELITKGFFEEYDDIYVIRYTEIPESPEPEIQVFVRVSKDLQWADITRSSKQTSCIFIEKSSRSNPCNYRTEYGDILMGIKGVMIDIDYDGEKGCFFLVYDISFNGNFASRNTVTLKFRKVKS